MALCAAHPLKNQTMHTSIKEISNTDTITYTSLQHQQQSILHIPQICTKISQSQPQNRIPISQHAVRTSIMCIPSYNCTRRYGEGKRRPSLDLPDSRPQFRPVKSNAQPNWCEGLTSFSPPIPLSSFTLRPMRETWCNCEESWQAKWHNPEPVNDDGVYVMSLRVSIPHVLAQWVGMANVMTTWIEGCAFCWW